MDNIRVQLNDLYNLHMAAIKLQHGVKRKSWKLFEPSKFIYAYFAFNSFYSINWEESLSKQELINWEYNSSKNDEKMTESQKIREMIKFIYSTFVVDNKDKNIKEIFSVELSKKIIRYLPVDKREAIENLNKIVLDSNIKESDKERFISKFNLIINHEITGKDFKKAWHNVLHFVYNVRNNIFHGTKTILDMMDEDQKDRLEIYTAILLGTNEILFDSIEKRFNWTRDEIDSNYIMKTKRKNRSIQNDFYRNTIASKFNITVPSGILFYPCVGNDTYYPIKLFMDLISEYHFVDSRLIPKIPKLECDFEGSEEVEFIRDRKIGKEIIKSATAIKIHNDNISDEIMKELERKGAKSTGYNEEAGTIYEQEWELTKDNRKIKIYRHVQDGLAAFSSIENISVFFLRRDSEGEGGSGQRWFQESIFKIILEKLVDGGLIVTDGSSYDGSILNTADWKNIWINSDKGPNDKSIKKPNDFNYYNREFKCIGRVSSGYGPVYVWKVNKV